MSELANRQSVTKAEVYDYLQDRVWHTKKEIASHFNVTAPTIGSRMKELDGDYVSTVHGRRGYRLINPADVTDEETALDVEKMTRWMIMVVTRQAMKARPMKKLMSKARALLPRDKEERAIVRKYLVQLTHLIDWDEADEE